MTLLQAIDLVFERNGRKILDGLSLEVWEGEVHALLGANGTGKSTLAYLVMGCEGYAPSPGDILFRGKSLAGLAVYERARLGITMAWQEPVRFEGISVRDYITLKDKGIDPAAAVRLVGLSPEKYLDRMVDRCLSGGQRKRVELASVLALGPALAVLDEPDSGIDMLSTQDIINVINTFREGGSSVLLITHRQEIALIADRASHLCHGTVIATGKPEEIARQYLTRRCAVCVPEECEYVRT